MAEESERSRNGDRDRDIEGPQDPVVERRRPEPRKPAAKGLTLKGFLGDSDRAGYRRLYFTRTLDYYAEFSVQDVVDTARIPPERLPFPGEEATEVMLKKGANIEYTHNRVVRVPDEFDLDFRRLHRTRRRATPFEWTESPEGECPPATWEKTCEATCGDQFTCYDTYCMGGSCDTCWETCYTCGTCGKTGCTGCCPMRTDDPPCGPSAIETACETGCFVCH
ncbi:hypothetical protein JBE04_27200 [Streptomyces sp. PRKS01-29]|nr:hypothetical protein [Streptomyces sabulosicollis]MBI0298053.1 hypothetical protein [Streptomyces sabulosicollis]